MKIAEMSTDQAADVLLVITPLIGEIIDDQKLMDLFKNRETTNDQTKAVTFGIKFITELTAHMLKEHRKALWSFLASLNNQKANEIAKQPFLTTLNQVKEIFQDEDLIGFFTSLAPSAQGTSSDILQK